MKKTSKNPIHSKVHYFIYILQNYMNKEERKEGRKKLASAQNVNYVVFKSPFYNVFDILNSSQKSYYNYKTYSLV